LERELQSTIEHEQMISVIHENLLNKFTASGRAPNPMDAYADGNDGEQFYNAVIDERPTRDLGFNNNNRNIGFGATP
jgi:hypothetical protein